MARSFGFGSACVAGLVCGVILGGCIMVVDRDGDSWARSWNDDRDQPRLGVSIDSPGKTLAAQLQIDRGDATVITGVAPDSPAARAGLRKYDVITRIDGDSDADPSDLRHAVRAKEWGDSVNLTVIREGQTMEIAVPLEREPAQPLAYPS